MASIIVWHEPSESRPAKSGIYICITGSERCPHLNSLDYSKERNQFNCRDGVTDEMANQTAFEPMYWGELIDEDGLMETIKKGGEKND